MLCLRNVISLKSIHVKTYIPNRIFLSFLLYLFMAQMNHASAQTEQTYAEKLGWKKGDRVIILHIDDAGMSYDSNLGAIKAMEEGVANSVSVMMPCPWVPSFV